MKTIFITSKNSKTSEPNRFRLDLTDKLDLKDPKKKMALANLNIYCTWQNVKSEYNDNKFEIPAPTWNDSFDRVMVLIQFLTFKITSNLSSRNTKL